VTSGVEHTSIATVRPWIPSPTAQGNERTVSSNPGWTPTRLRRLVQRWRTAPGEVRALGSLRVWLLYRPGPGPAVMSWLRKRWVIFRHPHAHIEFQGPVYLGPRFSLDMPFGGTFIAGPGSEFRRGFRAELAGPESRITIGSHTVFTYDVIIQCATSVEIGCHCAFGQASLVVDGNHRFREGDRPMLEQGYSLRPLRIGDHATVTTKCTIIADVGDRTFVGANSVVSRPLPSFCLAVGAPARVVDYFGPPGQAPPGLSPRSASAEAAG
jgi:acetyltransferase-like isoleucine patch superfamily enzyme